MKTIHSPFIEKLNEKNLASWYMLPLMGLSVNSFGESNFVDAYQVRGKAMIAVAVKHSKFCLTVCKNQSYNKLVLMNGVSYFVFNIPARWVNDYQFFLEGKYSRMSDDAKQKIKELSGLKYEVADNLGNKLTDAVLMALGNHHALRSKWIEIIGTTEFWLPAESLSVLKASSFIELENV